MSPARLPDELASHGAMDHDGKGRYTEIWRPDGQN